MSSVEMNSLEESPCGYREIHNQLLAKIQNGTYPVGSLLPPIVKTSRDFGVSYVTAQRAYRELAHEGIVRSRRGRGAEILRTRPRGNHKQHVVGCLIRPLKSRNIRDNYALEMYESAAHELANRDVSVLYRRYMKDKTIASDWLLEDVRLGRVAGVLIDEPIPDNIVEQISALGHPAVIYGRHSPNEGVGSVNTDYALAGRITARRILDAGYQHIVCVNQRIGSYHQTSIGQARIVKEEAYNGGIARELDGYGVGDSMLTILPEDYDDGVDRWLDDAYIEEKITAQLRSRKGRIAFVASSDRWALRVKKTLEQHGVTVPSQCGVIGRYNQEINQSAAVPPVSTWDMKPSAVGKAAVEMLIERMDFPERKVTHRYIQPQFMDNGSL